VLACFLITRIGKSPDSQPNINAEDIAACRGLDYNNDWKYLRRLLLCAASPHLTSY
jgi:hypothetical protein